MLTLKGRTRTVPSTKSVWIANFGDSLTFGAGVNGFRYEQFLYQTVIGQNLVRTGNLSDGIFPSPLHQGMPAQRINTIVAALIGLYPSTFSRVDIGHVLWGTNDARQIGAGGYNGEIAQNDALNGLHAIYKIFPNIVLINTTIPPIDPAFSLQMAQQADDFNSRLINYVWPTYNATHPRPLIIWDAHAVIPVWNLFDFSDSFHWSTPVGYAKLNPAAMVAFAEAYRQATIILGINQ